MLKRMIGMTKNVSRILVIREAAIGDVLCMTPFLRELKSMFPNAKVDYVVVDWARDVIMHNPNIDQIFTVTNDYIFGDRMSLVLKRLSYYSKLAKNNYDVVFCPSTQLIFRIALIPFTNSYKIGFDTVEKGKRNFKNFMLDDYVFIDLNEIPRTFHIADRNLQMLECLQVKDKKHKVFQTGLEVYSSPLERQKVQNLLNELGWQDEAQIIAVAPSSGSAVKSDAALKTVPKDRFVQIIQALQLANPNRLFALMGAKTERDYVEKLGICDNKKIVNLCGKLSLVESSEFLKKCKILISNDSGITHIASALKMNHVVLFGPTDDIEFGPYKNPNAHAIRTELPCEPCRDSMCRVPETNTTKNFRRPFCLDMIDFNNVVKLVNSILS